MLQYDGQRGNGDSRSEAQRRNIKIFIENGNLFTDKTSNIIFHIKHETFAERHSSSAYSEFCTDIF